MQLYEDLDNVQDELDRINRDEDPTLNQTRWQVNTQTARMHSIMLRIAIHEEKNSTTIINLSKLHAEWEKRCTAQASMVKNDLLPQVLAEIAKLKQRGTALAELD